VKLSPPIGLILLAAGGSKRLGRPKQLLRVDGQALIRHATQAALGSRCRPVVVVLGAATTECLAQIADLPVCTVLNDRWEEGMAGSIQAGLDALLAEAPQITSVIVCLCDQPRLTSFVLDALIAAHLETGKPVVASAYGGVLGAPALFAASCFPELRALTGDQGARRLFNSRPGDVATVPFEGGAADIDTEADLDYLRPEKEERPLW
jgi:molybdenum cofactor cytidylyltransferase